jgi:hypothetical protein
MSFELSPTLLGPVVPGAPLLDAYELKFHLRAAAAEQVEAWARQRLVPDPHGPGGAYLTTTVYCDTPGREVYHRLGRFKGNKFRLRRYEESDQIYLERKRRRGDRVRKRRNAVPLDELAVLAGPDVAAGWPALWFHRQLRARQLAPVCRIGYRRTAFQGTSPTGPIRLTLDRDVRGVPAQAWDVPMLTDGLPLLTGSVILEMKFRASLPVLFRELLDQLPPAMGAVSKYRLCVEEWGLAGRRA